MPDKKIIWVTKSKNVYTELKDSKMPVVMYNSLSGIYYQLRAGIVVYCTGSNDLFSRLLGGAVHINLWHGVGGGKKIGFDADVYDTEISLKNKLLQDYAFKKTYYLATSLEMKKVFMSAFHVPSNHFIYAGQPRNDFFYDSRYIPTSYSEDLFNGKKVVLYLPTHRKEGKKKLNCSELFDLRRLNSLCEKYECLFVIKKHFYHSKEVEKLEDYSNILDLTNNLDIDTNELLKRADILVSDYSSVTADFLLLDRPIIYYCFDLQNYLSEDRDVYWSYDSITPGPKVQDYDELQKTLVAALSGKDEYRKDRSRVLDMFYSPDSRCKASPLIASQIEKIMGELEC